MRNFFALSAAGVFFLAVLTGYLNDASLLTILGRALTAYAVLIGLGAVLVSIRGPKKEPLPHAEESSVSAEDYFFQKEKAGFKEANRKIAENPEQAAEAIKRMMK